MYEGGDDQPANLAPAVPGTVEVSNAKTNQVDSIDGCKQENMDQIAMSLKTYTRDEVSLHNTETDCWMIYKNKVFDVTSFISEHPAGPDYIKDYAGVDATTAFDDVGHSEAALKLMLKYHIGDIDTKE